MPIDFPPYEVLYVSDFAPDQPLSSIAAIAARSRTTNASHGITGLLVFDGLRFCQQLEGRQENVLPLVERIRRDPRHTDVAVLHHGPLAKRRFRNFSLAFSTLEEADALERLRALKGTAAVAAFKALPIELEM
ncbi:BLUF domain-containing protein [Acidovorax sp. SUPP3334]|uniref:BLUF domain-containing protein n=1 Tax=Acidovorax sp. SUPP3334 TaxID=2920881 RepID=UPI0023DE34A5|nr:BLUF domain-containing protein [Acidovorax sp. SUPP3334]GKT26435.1 BLUF domain-containing protein [Acidovorax sp. SUPP3334]